MYVFGGMCGARLDDLWQLDLGKFNLIQGQELVMIDKSKYKNCFKIFFIAVLIELHLDLFITSTVDITRGNGYDVNGCC